MLLTPLAAWLGRLLAKRLERGEHSDHAPGTILAELDNHVVIGGCGRVGQLIAQVLEKENVPYVCLDTDGDNVARMRGHDRPVYFGDAARSELLEKVGGRRARAFVVTLNDARAAERMVSAARRVNRGALIFARAADTAHAARLVKRGAFGVIPETVEASLQLAGRLLEVLDVPDDVVALRLSELRAAEVAKLDEAEIKEMNRAKASG
jgi:CPA2 family monovalent cation:H+ antiporter-2